MTETQKIESPRLTEMGKQIPLLLKQTTESLFWLRYENQTIFAFTDEVGADQHVSYLFDVCGRPESCVLRNADELYLNQGEGRGQHECGCQYVALLWPKELEEEVDLETEDGREQVSRIIDWNLSRAYATMRGMRNKKAA